MKTMTKAERLARLQHEAYREACPKDGAGLWELLTQEKRQRYLRMASVLLRRGVRLPEEDS